MESPPQQQQVLTVYLFCYSARTEWNLNCSLTSPLQSMLALHATLFRLQIGSSVHF